MAAPVLYDTEYLSTGFASSKSIVKIRNKILKVINTAKALLLML